ncbi:hypothetical protein F5Y17DRAFT_464524 [Xylariaceae sp. FL0594]|nr:hypothetical protein F5Y17DRAFT_464524 [Xylariaceae sp. FL0594]
MALTPPVADEMSVDPTAISPVFDVDRKYDPFRSPDQSHHRFSHFDSDLFPLGPDASPAQAKRALEAHIAETDRRMEEAGRLGAALLEQRNELENRLEEVKALQAKDELSDDLRQKLIDIERDYDEVARESARAFLPKSRVPSNEASVGSPLVPESKGSKRAVSPSKFETQATPSPTKFSVPNRKIRNQPTNRIHDIEFAAEISTSLIGQVRSLQGLLAEKDEEMKVLRVENLRLEYEMEGFQQRLKNLDDNEHRYKDENWNLETQIHELLAKEREAAEREKKLTQAFNVLQAEKNTAQRELDEIKLSHAKLTEQHIAAVKHHDIELGTAKRTMVMAESERAAMQRKIEDLTGQNQELAKAVSASIRGRKLERESILRMSDEDFHTAHDNTTPEQSPPPSPVKVTPRHSMLESETLKTSLAHAQRTIQSLRTNVHREKTEKMETRRLLQEARDEIERLRSDTLVPTTTTKRSRKAESSRDFRKPPRLLGGLRTARSEIVVDDPNWEDQPDTVQHARSSPVSRETTVLLDPVPEHNEQFETANETSDAAFETANELVTETDDFHTGAEEFSSDDVETETESPSRRLTRRGGKSQSFSSQRGMSIDSSASTEDEDFPYEDTRTPTLLPPLQAKFPLRVSRGAFRRSRRASEEPTLQSSPASFANSSNMGTPQQPAQQSLAAELGDFDGSDNESNMSATPSRRSTRGRATTPPPALPRMARAVMVDSATMTEPLSDLAHLSPGNRPLSMNTVISTFSTGSSYSDAGTQDLGDKLTEFPTPPTFAPKKDTVPAELAFSTLHSHDVEPLAGPDTHGEEIAALRTKHAEDVASIEAAHTAAMEALKLQHSDELDKAAVMLKGVHAQEIDTLRSEHAEAINKSTSDLEAAHARAVESLHSQHADELSNASAAAQAAYERELETLKANHADELAKQQQKYQATHTADLEALKSQHAQELERRVTELRASHADELVQQQQRHRETLISELEALKSQHAQELERQEAQLKADHADELVQQQGKHVETLAAELETLKSQHAQELERQESQLKASHAADLENLKAKHAELCDELAASLTATALADMESLKSRHVAELSQLRTDSQSAHTAEVDALVQAHTGHIEAIERDLREAHTKEFEELKSSHAAQVEQVKESIVAEYDRKFEALELAHSEQTENLKRSVEAAHAEEIESIRTALEQQLADVKTELASAHAATMASLVESHQKEIDDLGKTKDSAHDAAVASLLESHQKEMEDLGRKKDSAHDSAVASLIDSHRKEMDDFGREKDSAHDVAVASLIETHRREMDDLGKEKDSAHAAAMGALAVSHKNEIDEVKHVMSTSHAHELESLKSVHAKQQSELRTELESSHAAAIAAMAESHSKQVETLKAEGEAALSREIVALKGIHAQEIEALNSQHAAAHAKELDGFKAALAKQVESSKAEGDAAHSQQIEALNAAHAEIIEAHKRDAETAHSQAIEALHASHEREIDTLKSEHAAAKTKELEVLTNRHLDEMKTLRHEAATAKAAELAELTNKHLADVEVLKAEVAAAKAAELEELTKKHLADMETLRTEAAVSKAAELEELTNKHLAYVETLRAEDADRKAVELEELTNRHLADMQSLKDEYELSRLQLAEELSARHSEALESLQQTHSESIASLEVKHALVLETLKSEYEAKMTRQLEEVTENHSKQLADLRREVEQTKLGEIAALTTSHTNALESLKASHEVEMNRRMQELGESHARELEDLRQRAEADKSRELAALRDEHQTALHRMNVELGSSHHQKLSKLKSAHDAALASLSTEHQSRLDEALSNLNAEHFESLEAAKAEANLSQSQALEALEAEHSQQLEQLKNESEAALARELGAVRAEHAQILEQQLEQLKNESEATFARELDAVKTQHAQVLESLAQESEAKLARELDNLRAEHAKILESYIQESTADKENLIVRHAEELEALRASMTVIQPPLKYSPVSTVQTEPVEVPELKSPRREAFIIPLDREPVTPGNLYGEFSRKSKAPDDDTVIAEDETRQSPSSIINSSAAPDSELPFKEITTNTDGRSLRKSATTAHQGSQTALTGEGLDHLMNSQGQGIDESSASSPPTVRVRRPSVDSTGSVVRLKPRTSELGAVAAAESMPARRPGSSASHRSATQNRPPLPPNHLEVIEAARSGSAQGSRGAMGPPQVPAASDKRPLSPTSARLVPVSSAATGYADVHTPSRVPMRSRQSSISSFASEIDSRFNIKNGMGMGPAGFHSSTDPRMIQAVTQTMIGEYLWKYTRKAGRGEMSENRHRRFFWVHPYTRTLYWSDADPATAGRGEMRAKSVPIEAVRVVADDNPMPPGLHRKSLVVIAPGRTIKFTCTTGQRHETWFNALSYLLLRSGNEDKQEAEDASGHITQEDVDEFNPSIHRRPTNGTRSRPPPSLSSYNSRTTRNESPSLEMSIPTLTPTHEREIPRSGTLGRLSGYWKSSSLSRGTFSSLRRGNHQPYDGAIYEASEVPDSAEDLRQIIEQQDRESDRLENVRACCDGKHDVGTLPRTSKRGRISNVYPAQPHSHTHTHPDASTSQAVVESTRSRV